jgi:hypothetical protein
VCAPSRIIPRDASTVLTRSGKKGHPVGKPTAVPIDITGLP